MTRPHKIMAAADTVRRLIESAPLAESSLAGRARRWLAGARLARLARLPLASRIAALRPDRGEGAGALDRARWMSTGPALEFAIRARARKLVTLEIDDSLA